MDRSSDTHKKALRENPHKASDRSAHKAMYWDDGEAIRGEAVASQFDWNLIRKSMFTEPAEIFTSNSSMRTERNTSPFYADTQSDSIHYSFMASDNSDIASVDPNLIFSEPSSATGSMIDGFNGGNKHRVAANQKPYQHQYLQRQREQEERARRRQQKENTDVTSARTLRHKKGSYATLLSASSGIRRSSSVPRSTDNHSSASNRKVSNSNSRTSPTKSTKSRTEVVLEISPSGRAKAQTTVIYESESEKEPVDWDSLDESDSSFDGDTPRGLAPDGSEYSSFRQRSDPVSESKPPTSTRFSTRPLHSVPRTPTKNRHASASAVSATRRNGIESSPRLPTPLRSSPPPSMGILRRTRSAMATNVTSQTTIIDEDNSEAETVVDEPLGLHLAEDPDDAISALRQVVARGGRRGGSYPSPPFWHQSLSPH